MSDRVEAGGLAVARVLYDFINDEALPGTGVAQDRFWDALGALIHDLAPRNRALLALRDDFQSKIDTWHREHRGPGFDAAAYKAFLQEIGYLVPAPDDVEARTANVDPEFATIAGPQLVVPVSNARYALNAANARWGSLYDALYGTDAIPHEEGGAEKGSELRTGKRGEKVIGYARGVLDRRPPRWPPAPTTMPSKYARAQRLAGGRAAQRRRESALVDPGGFRWLHGSADDPDRAPVPPSRPAHRGGDRPRATRSARPTRPASPTW